jgi:hypothetical protein
MLVFLFGFLNMGQKSRLSRKSNPNLFFCMTAVGRVLSLAFTLVISPLSGAKQTFRKHKSNVYESRLSAKSGNSFVQNETGPPESDGPKLAAFRNRSQLIP